MPAKVKWQQSDRMKAFPDLRNRMKKLEFVRWAALASVAWLMNSCDTVGPQQSTAVALPRFHENTTTDMVLRFYRWDTIYMTKPDTREGGFLPPYARDDIAREVKSRNIPRNTAVVVVSPFGLSSVQLAQLSQTWTGYLNEQGFPRVVILAGPGKEIDGLPVLNDSTIGGVNAAGIKSEQSKVTSANAAVPSAAGV